MNELMNLDRLQEIVQKNALNIYGLVTATKEIKKEVEDIGNRLTIVEDSTTISPAQKRFIRNAVKETVSQIASSRKWDYKLSSRFLFSSIYNYLGAIFGISSYEEIRKIEYDRAMEKIREYQPTEITEQRIKLMLLEKEVTNGPGNLQ